jgi:DNA repair exonuclease SbcCD ATPase subunit
MPRPSGRKKNLTEELVRYEGEVRERYRMTVEKYDRARARIRQLECQADHYEGPEGSLRVVFPPPAPLPNAAPVAPSSRVEVVVKTSGPGPAALCRREARKLTRDIQKLEQQLADLEREGQRIADIRSSTERRFADFRLAAQAP